MSRLLGVALGVLTAIGGFLDIGDLVTNAVVGSRFGLSLAWVVVLGVVGICLFADMSARVAVVSGRATFEVIRERLSPRAAGANLVASFLVTLLTLAEQDQLTVEEEDELVEDEDDDYEDGDYDSYDGYKPPPGVGMIRIGDVYKTRAQVLYISYSF